MSVLPQPQMSLEEYVNDDDGTDKRLDDLPKRPPQTPQDVIQNHRRNNAI